MIRSKCPDADLKRSYRKVLSGATGLSALLHLGLFAIDPRFEFEPVRRHREVIVIELQPIPETSQPLPSPRRLPQKIETALPDTSIRYPVVVGPPEVVVEFAPDSEEEVVEFWMLEKKPLVRKKVLPKYPDSAREALIEGKVFVRILLNRQGRVERVGQVTGPEVFHRAVAEAARRWEFTPAIQNDQAVKVWVSLPFTFQLEDRAIPVRTD